MTAVLFTRFEDHAVLPAYKTSGAIGLDLSACIPEIRDIQPGCREAINTGLGIIIPRTHYGRIAPRSGLAFAYGIDVLAGVIDSDYRGAIVVILQNNSAAPFAVTPGARIAQLIIEQAAIATVREINVDDFRNYGTRRGTSGFGSTGASD